MRVTISPSQARTGAWGSWGSSRSVSYAFVLAAFALAACLLLVGVTQLHAVALSTDPVAQQTPRERATFDREAHSIRQLADDAVAGNTAFEQAGALTQLRTRPQRDAFEEAEQAPTSRPPNTSAHSNGSLRGSSVLGKADAEEAAPRLSRPRPMPAHENVPHGIINKAPRLHLQPIRRVDNITSSEFQVRLGEQFGLAPVVITNSQSDWLDPALFTRERLRDYIGDMPLREPREQCRTNVTVRDTDKCHSIKERHAELMGKAWAGLSAVNLTELNVTTYSDFMDAQRAAAQRGRQMYAFDMAVTDFPAVAERIRIPKYFLNSYHDITSEADEVPEHAGRWTHFPSIFFGEAGSGSPLHSDSLMTRFWVVALNGRKRLRVLPPSENWRLKPTDGDDQQPSIFKADLFSERIFEDFPDADGMLVYDTTLESGDLLFIPDGWPHQAENLDWSLMLTQNVIDGNNVDNFLRAKVYENDGERDKDYLEDEEEYWPFFLPIHDPHADHDNMPLRTFHLHHMLEHAPVSQAAKTFVNDLDERGVPPGEWRDRFSVPLLWAAAHVNYVKLCEWLLLKGAPVNGINPATRSTPLDVAAKKGYRKLAQLLKAAGGLETGDDEEEQEVEEEVQGGEQEKQAER